MTKLNFVTEGADKAARQREMIHGRITDGKLFGDILQNLEFDMASKLKGVCERVENALAETFDSIQEDVKMITPAGEGNRATAEQRFKKQLAAEVQRFKAKYQGIIHSISSPGNTKT